MYMIFICPNFYKLNFVPLLYFQTGFLQYLVDFFTKYFPILRWTYKVVYQYRDIVTLPPGFTHTSILLFFAASCGEMPSFDYIHYNPIKHGYSDTFDREWSSYWSYYGKDENIPPVIDPKKFQKCIDSYGE